MVGSWSKSPIGPFSDVMWAPPGGQRVLLVGDERSGRFVSAMYRFDRVEVVPLSVDLDGAALAVVAGDLRLELQAGSGWRIPLRRLRPPWVTRWVEGPLAHLLFGVHTYGVSPTGVREWYRADEYRRVTRGRAQLGNRDAGAIEPRWQPASFGFSEPPRSSAMVRVRPVLHDPSGRLDRVLAVA